MEREPADALRTPANRGESAAVEHGALADALPGYELAGELGRGAGGVVLAGYHRGLGREVAIKRLPLLLGADPELRARFFSEARLLAALDHPHIVRVYDFVEAQSTCALVMQRLDGGTVADRLERGELGQRAACAVILAACSALHYAHAKGVVHCDIKPQNLMFSAEDVLKVSDFGIARALTETGVGEGEGGLVGTPAYIAPEVAQGAAPGPAADVYAAGVTLYLMLCGELPFPAAADAVTEIYQHVHLDPVPLSERDREVPAAVGEVTERALARDPEQRYPSSHDFGAALGFAAADAWGPAWSADTGVVLLGAQHGLQTPAAAAAPRATTTVTLTGDDGTPVSEPGDGFYVAGVDDELVNHLYLELASVGREPSVARVRALCRLAIELQVAGAPAEHRRSVIAEAEQTAAALQDPQADLVLLYSSLVATWSPDDLPGRLASADALIARAEQADDPAMAFRARRLRLRALLEAGDDAGADREIATLDAATARLAGLRYRWQATLYEATGALRDGDAEAARRLMTRALELGQTVEPDIARRCFDDQAARQRLLAGAARELIPGLREAAESCPWMIVRQAALVYGLTEVGRRTEALLHFEDLADDDFRSVPRDANWLATMVLLSRACARLDDRRRARILHQVLEPYQDRFAVTGDCTVTWGAVSSALEALEPVL